MVGNRLVSRIAYLSTMSSLLAGSLENKFAAAD